MFKLNQISAAIGAATLAVVTAPAMAQAVDPMAQAFTDVEAKITAVGAFSLGLAVVGALVWTGIKLFRKGVSKGGGAA